MLEESGYDKLSNMKYFIIAGEKSGDKQGALLIRELLLRQPELEIEGLGGELMHELAPGIENWAEEAAVIGIVDVLRKFSFFKNNLDAMTARITEQQPDALILIDYPGFNQRLAERIHKSSPRTKDCMVHRPHGLGMAQGTHPQACARARFDALHLPL